MTKPGPTTLDIAKATLLAPFGIDEVATSRVFGTILAHKADDADLYFQYNRSEGWTLEEGERLCREELTLEHVASHMDVPILTVCSADDETMPTTESAILKERAKGPVEIVTFPGKGHGGPSRLSLPLEADWMRDRLMN